MKPPKQTVYLPVSNGFLEIIDVVTKQKVEEVKKAGEIYCFTPEQLNEYTASVIQQALETAAENARMSINDDKGLYSEFDVPIKNGREIYTIKKQSIINTFDKIFRKFKV